MGRAGFPVVCALILTKDVCWQMRAKRQEIRGSAEGR